MFFLPYRLDATRNGLPLLTLAICLLCVFVYWQQFQADRRYFQAIEQFCLHDLGRRELAWLDRVPAQGIGNHCASLLEKIRASDDANAEIARLAGEALPIRLYRSAEANRAHVEANLAGIYDKFERTVPRHLTSRLAYDPRELDLVRMVTATFSHADALHLLGNLLFFYIFAASVELVLGLPLFLLFVVVSTFGTSLAYRVAMSGVADALPTVGLSGVVMAALAALAVMLPTVRIRCFLWIVVFFRILRVPALLIAVWYIGWDIYSMNQHGNTSVVNYVAHVSGAAIGALFGLHTLLFRRQRLRDLTASAPATI